MDEKEIKKKAARMLSSEDQLLETMSEYDTDGMIESYDRICEFLKQMPEQDAAFARTLMSLGMGRIIYVQKTKRLEDGSHDKNEV